MCALLENGEIYCWGYDVCGDLGHGEAMTEVPVDQRADEGDPVQQKSKATAIAVGEFTRCLLDEHRQLTCWGSDWPDNGHEPGYTCPAPPSEATPHHVEGPVLDLAIGTWHACALDAGHDLYCWGANHFGELGYGHEEDMTFPGIPPVETGGKIVAVEANSSITCALYEGGRARCWGLGFGGQLGQGNTEHIGDDEVPADVPFIDIGEPIEQIAIGSHDSVCALTISGQVRCWGSNEYGQLGLGHRENIGDDEVPASVPPVQLLR
jgi:alpha-tubulin suppressor-like RCC1 family protein